LPTSNHFNPPRQRRIFPRPFGQGCGRAEDAFSRERALAPIFVNSILNRAAFEDAVVHRISARLGNDIVPAYLVNDVFGQAVAGDETIGAGFRADIVAVLDRDPACERLIEPLLYFKGFHAIQTHRLAHQWSERFRALSAEPVVRLVSDRHPSGGGVWQGHLP
jgi:hypothetical protein